MATLMSGNDFRLITSPPLTIGVDVGQKVDPTAICVMEARPSAVQGEPVFTTRLLQRLPLGTSYLAVADRLVEVVTNIAAQPVQMNHAPPSVTMLIDATGVGAPIVDMMRKALRGSRCRVTPVTFVHGERLTTQGHGLRMGKEFLVGRLTMLMESGRVDLPVDHPEAAAMRRELEDYERRLKAGTAGTMQYGAMAAGSHDDLVTAVALASLRDSSGRGVWSC